MLHSTKPPFFDLINGDAGKRCSVTEHARVMQPTEDTCRSPGGEARCLRRLRAALVCWVLDVHPTERRLPSATINVAAVHLETSARHVGRQLALRVVFMGMLGRSARERKRNEVVESLRSHGCGRVRFLLVVPRCASSHSLPSCEGRLPETALLSVRASRELLGCGR